jgi:hypothetical protein
MDVASLRPTIESAIRLIIIFLFGKLGFEAVDAQVGAAAAVLSAIVLGVLSLWWSKASDKKVVETVKAGGAS